MRSYKSQKTEVADKGFRNSGVIMNNKTGHEKCLILLTNYYPYFKGEEYLESEIQYLSQSFDRIIIIATMIGNDEKPTRQLPENTSAYASGVAHSLRGKAKMILRNFIPASREMKASASQDDYGRGLKKLYATYFEARTMTIYPSICQILEKENIKSTGSVIIYSYWLYITARLAVQLKLDYFQDRIPYTLSRAHRYDVDEEASALKFLPFRLYLLKSLDAIHPVSSYHESFLKNKYPAFADKVSRRALGVNAPSITFEERTSLPFDQTIVSVSAMRKVKRIDLLIEALSLLAKNYPDLKFKWVHFGAGGDFERMKKLASKKLPSDKYELKGHRPNTELQQWYEQNKPKVFVNVSTSEGVPVSIMEACSYGIPVLATDAGGNSDIVKDHVNGRLLPIELSKEQLAKTLHELLTADEESIRMMSNQAYNTWLHDFNAEKLYRAFSAELLNRASTGMTES